MLQGKGFYLWNIVNCEKGDVQQIASVASQAGLTHLLIKVADRYYPHNVSKDGSVDYVPPLADALRKVGIQVWGWQYVYGYEPAPEARMAIQRIEKLNLDGFVIDAEEEYKLDGRKNAATRYLGDLRNRYPDLPIALSSFRFPTLHPQLPWEEFLTHVDFNMPQVYWLKAHNPAAQLERTLREFRNRGPERPVFPTGAAYKWSGWRPTPDDITEFMQAVTDNKLSGCNFWGWEFARRDLPECWDVIANWDASTPAPEPAPTEETPTTEETDTAKAYMDALNSHNADQVVAFYHPLAVHIHGKEFVQGTEALRGWFQRLFDEVMPEARFIPQNFSGESGNRHITWKAVSRTGVVNNGADTLGLFNDKIIYHLSQFQLTAP